MRILLNLVRRSATLWAGVIIAGIEVWLALSARQPGLNLWADLVTGLSLASLYVGVIAAGFSAFEAGRWAPATSGHARGAARHPALVRMAHAAAAAVPILAGYLLALAVLGGYASLSGAYGAPSAGWLVALASGLLAAVGFGWVVGSVGRGLWWAAPAAAVLFFAFYVFVRALPLPYGVKVLYPVMLVPDYVFVRPVLATVLGMAAFSVAVVVLVLLLLGAGYARSRRGVAIACVIAGVFATGGAAAALSRDGQYTEAYNARDYTCDRRDVIICVNPGYAAALPPLRRRIELMNTRAAGTSVVATRLEQDIEGGPPPRTGTRSIHVEQLAAPDDIDFAVYRYVTQYGISETCRDTGNYSTGPRALVDTWLSGFRASERTPVEERAYDALRALPVHRGNAWFRDHYRQYFFCTLRLTDFP